MKRTKIHVKNTKVKSLLRKGGRKYAKRDFFELLRRAAKPDEKKL